ncbi:MAG: hypothetical protein JWL73_2158 [Actinomycetia bacterium]|nr:hypothetical protein [Actinomycetes bacterium]
MGGGRPGFFGGADRGWRAFFLFRGPTETTGLSSAALAGTLPEAVLAPV